MANTTNFNWETPDDTDLVKDGALAIRTLGNSIDTTLVDLKGGTTGQVLSKTSNTDMDFTWVTSDDANAIQNAIVDAKGDLIAASAADTPARLAVGNNGETLVADSSQTTGLRWGNNYGFTAGKNKLINGDFRINQRSFSSTTNDNTYTFDRWVTYTSGTDQTYTAQTFTAGTAPVAGYEGVNFLQVATTGGATKFAIIVQRIEDVRTFAGQTMTLSFWAKANSGTPKMLGSLQQSFGSGGSASVDITAQAVTISTSWARYSLTFTVPSISGKTIGTNSCLNLSLTFNNAFNGDIGQQTNTFQVWGVQAEIGSVATAFQTATGTLAGELAACQRYYYRFGGDSVFQYFGQGSYYNTTNGYVLIKNPVTMRTSPSSLDYSTLQIYDFSGTQTVTALSLDAASKDTNLVGFTIASGGTQFRPAFLRTNNSTSGYVGFSAEL